MQDRSLRDELTELEINIEWLEALLALPDAVLPPGQRAEIESMRRRRDIHVEPHDPLQPLVIDFGLGDSSNNNSHPDFVNADFQGANLSDATFANADLHGAELAEPQPTQAEWLATQVQTAQAEARNMLVATHHSLAAHASHLPASRTNANSSDSPYRITGDAAIAHFPEISSGINPANSQLTLVDRFRLMMRLLENHARTPVIEIFLGDNIYESTSAQYRPPADFYSLNATREPAQDFIIAVRRNDREFVDQYIHEHCREPDFYFTLTIAVQFARTQNNGNLIASLMQLVTERDLSRDDNKTNNAASMVIVLNKKEELLEKCNFTGTVPDPLCCVVTEVIMEDPITTCSGYTMERDAFRKWLSNKVSCPCPITRLAISASELENTTNICLSAYIDAFVRNNGVIDLKEIASLLLCPVKKELFKDPVTFVCGLTAERKAIEELFAKEDTVCDAITIEEKYIIKRSELKRGSTIAIINLVEIYLDAKKKHDDEAIANSVPDDSSPTLSNEERERVCSARLKIFGASLTSSCDSQDLSQVQSNQMKK